MFSKKNPVGHPLNYSHMRDSHHFDPTRETVSHAVRVDGGHLLYLNYNLQIDHYRVLGLMTVLDQAHHALNKGVAPDHIAAALPPK